MQEVCGHVDSVSKCSKSMEPFYKMSKLSSYFLPQKMKFLKSLLAFPFFAGAKMSHSWYEL